MPTATANPSPLVPLGQLGATPAAVEALTRSANEHVKPSRYLARHVTGDWGELDDAEDLAANDAALIDQARILSQYHLPDGTRIWIITEADRSVTTFLLPEDY